MNDINGHIIEPRMMILCSEVVELVEAQRKLAWIESESLEEYYILSAKFELHYRKAAKNLRKFNRVTLSN